MAYTRGKDEIKKHCYDVLVRKHATSGNDNWGTIIDAQDLFVVSDAENESILTKWKGSIADGTATHPYEADKDACWCRLGALSENPSLKNGEGDTISLADCSEKVVSEVIELAIEDLQVSYDNYTELRWLANQVNNEFVDILFVPISEVAADSSKNGIGFRKVTLKVYLEITGNDYNKVLLSGKRETSNADDFMNFVDVTL